MSFFGLDELMRRQRVTRRPYLEFIREASMSLGLYVLPAGALDGQVPHTEDEVYVVMGGRGQFTSGDETRAVGPSDVLFVAAGVPHRFHDIVDELRLIVVFAPPENSLGAR